MNKELFVAKGINISCGIISEIYFVFLEDRKELFEFNEVGSFVFSKINGKNTILEIINFCLLEYEGDSEEITRAVVEFIDEIEREKMVVFSEHKFEGVMQNE